MKKDYYEILDVPSTASIEAIREQYLFLIQAWHPDKFPNPTQKLKAEEKSKEINAAYAVLQNPQKRAFYDQGHVGQPASSRQEEQQQKEDQRRRKQTEEAQRRANYERQQKERAEEARRQAEYEFLAKAKAEEARQQAEYERLAKIKNKEVQPRQYAILGLLLLILYVSIGFASRTTQLASVYIEPTRKPTLTRVFSRTATPFQNINGLYRLELGECPNNITLVEGDPKEQGCKLLRSRDIQNSYINYIRTNGVALYDGKKNITNLYCAIFDLEGNVLDFQFDSDNDGKVICDPYKK